MPEKELKPTAGRILGIDELHLMGQYRCILTNIKEKTVIDLLKNRYKSTVVPYLRKLDGIDKVERVTMDMWESYRDACKVVIPDVPVTVDKFHVLKKATVAMEAIRKETQKKLLKTARTYLKRSRFILLSRKDSLEPEDLETIEQWRKLYPDLIDAWELKESFFRIYDEPTPEAAREAFKKWQYDFPVTIHYKFKEVAKTVNDWEPEIFNYFDERITNAWTECANGLAKITNRTGRGHSFKVLRFKILFHRRLHPYEKLSIRSRMAYHGIPFSTFDEPEFREW